MKPAAIAAAIGSALTASAVLAAPALADEVTIRNAVARVIVIPEDRADVGVHPVTRPVLHRPRHLAEPGRPLTGA